MNTFTRCTTSRTTRPSSHNLAFGKLLPRYKAEYERLLKKLNAIMEETGTLPQDYKPPDRQVLDPIAGV